MQWVHAIEQSLEQLNLIDHAEDLKCDGLTIVPPGKTGLPGQTRKREVGANTMVRCGLCRRRAISDF